MSRHAAMLLLALPGAALAQAGLDGADPVRPLRADDWSVGAAVSVRDSPYAGEGTRTRLLPLVSYEGERLFWRGLTGGVHLFRRDGFEFDAIVSGRFDGFDIEDLGRDELARNGLDASQLEDRDDGLDAGFGATWRGRAGELTMRALADITDASGGHEFVAGYGYAFHLGRTTLIPGASVRWMSSDLTAYYYGTGTVDEERARGVPVYAPGSAVVPRVNLGIARPLGRNWRLLGSIDYELLPDEITDSPLIEPDTDGSARLMIGISRGF